MAKEPFPVSDTLKVIDGKTIYKTDKWWSAVIFLESFGRKQIATYLWNNANGVWKRRQKFMIQSVSDWNKIKEAIEEYISRL